MLMKTSGKVFLWIVSIIIAVGIGFAIPGFAQQQKKQSQTTVPTFYLHGYSGTANSTNGMISYATKNSNAHKVFTATVDKNGKVTLKGDWSKDVSRPIVQVVFQDNRNNNFKVTQSWFKNVLTAVNKKHSFKQFNAVAHSMGNLTLMYYELYNGPDKKLPQLQKQINIAGHFDGILGRDDKANENTIQANGEPKILNSYYKDQLNRRNNFPKDQVDILNIYGNLNDGSNSDGDVTNVSSQSLRYLLRGRFKNYEEFRVFGPKAQHSQLHENEQVDKQISNFLW